MSIRIIATTINEKKQPMFVSVRISSNKLLFYISATNHWRTISFQYTVKHWTIWIRWRIWIKPLKFILIEKVCAKWHIALRLISIQTYWKNPNFYQSLIKSGCFSFLSALSFKLNNLTTIFGTKSFTSKTKFTCFRLNLNESPTRINLH